jgi:D-alanyl-lipoteichoic acid acyltransferase DltB (MBOAT superfamily)
MVSKLNYENLAVGLSLFILGLFKKVVIADTAVTYVMPFFDMAKHGSNLTFVEGWVAALAYTFQLYFDFSGYSDMAIGLARMFGILLPINFNSPYKAYNIIDFWRMWHITLSDWLRDYIFFPVRRSLLRKYRSTHIYLSLLVPPMITMLISGLWHGAGWTFVLWGGLHGIYLIINQFWRTINSKLILTSKFPLYLLNNISWLITFLSVVVAWVFFRAPTIHSALLMLKAMFGFNGFVFSLGGDISRREVLLFLMSALFIVKALPNSTDIMRLYNPVLEKDFFKHKSFISLSWKPTIFWGLLYIVLSLTSLRIMITKGYHEFIYRFF